MISPSSVSFVGILRERPDAFAKYKLDIRARQFSDTIYMSLVRDAMTEDIDRTLEIVLTRTNHGQIYERCIRLGLDPLKIATEIKELAHELYYNDISNDITTFLEK